MNHDAVDYFRVDFTPEDSIVDGKHYPLGTFAAEMLDRGWEAATDIRWPLKRFQEEFQVFLASRNPSSSGMALQAMRELWRVLGKLPLYNKLLPGDHQMEALLPYLDELQAFVKNATWMLEEFFQNLPSRKRQDYLRAYANYRWTMEEAMQQRKDTEDEGEVWEDATVDLDTVSFDYPVNISLVPIMETRTHRLTLAEQMTFESLPSFLYMDLYKGLAAGNLPRRCAHCRRWFLAEGGYDTLYCNRVVPGAKGKTCRQVGAHEREKEKRRTETAAREYSRIYNRLKARKRRGRITTDAWNRQVARAQELKDAFTARQITREEYVQKLDAL